MRTLIDFAKRAEYARIKALEEDLCEIGSQIDWERFRFLEPLMYKNKTSRGGRPNIDIVIMIKQLTQNKPTQRPTMRWVFEIFMGVIQAAIVQDGKVIKVSTNLNRTQITILALLGKECKNYYGME
jgi:hypothetical protein